MIFPEEKPCTPGELAHFGVKGMKWGVRKTQGTRDFYAKNPTSEQRSAAIDKARKNVEKARLNAKEQIKTATTKAEKKALKDTYLRHPDRATALRLKRGEKIVLGLLGAQGYLPPVALGVQVGTLARVGQRRNLED